MAIAALTLALIAPAAGQEGPAHLVRNINQSIDHRAGSWPSDFRAVGPYIYFQADDGEHGYEWYRTDRTPAGTFALRELGLPPPAPERAPEWPFTLHDGALWITDATGGETRLTLSPPDGAWSELGDLRLVDGAALFSNCDTQHGCELWRSDGTPQGTGLLIDIAPGEASALETNYAQPVVFDGALYFVATTAETGAELWRSDGSATGTQLVRDLNPGPGDGFARLGDGSPRLPSALVARGALFFIASDGVHGFELWRCDGTTAGTQMLADLVAGSEGAFDRGYDECQPRLLATAAPEATLYLAGCVGDPSAAWRLWESDGTAGGTALIDEIAGPMTVLGDQVFYIRRDDAYRPQLWRRARGAGHSTLVTTLPGGVERLEAVDGGMMLEVWTSETGGEPWWSDGSEMGTYLLRDIRGDDAGADPRQLIALGDLLLFSADDGVHGRELWRSDSTAAGTALVADIAAGARSSAPTNPVRIGEAVLFIADDGVHGAELWRSDGSAAGTRLLADIRPGATSSSPSNLFVAGAHALFYADDGVHGAELWSSDGTPQGTAMVLDSKPGPGGSATSDTRYFGAAVLRDALYFSADDGVHGAELWRSDGTEAGTAMVVDLEPGPTGAEPGYFGTTPDRLFFWRRPDYSAWQTDGTADGTRPYSDIGLYRFVTSGQATYASGRDPLSDREGVWRIDAAGPVVVAPRTDLGSMFDVDGALFGITNWGHDPLWRLDAPPENEYGWRPQYWVATAYAVAGRRLLLYADDYSPVLWTTDGTVEGMVQLQELPRAEYRPRLRDEDAGDFTVAGASIFFTIAAGDVGRELWTIPVDVLREVCVDDCFWMWTPTPTDTPEPATPTPTPVPPTPTATPDCGERCTIVTLDAGSGAPGETVIVAAHLSAEREPVVGLDLRFDFPADARVANTGRGRPDCTVDAAINKPATAFLFTPSHCDPATSCTGVRALVVAIDNVDSIADGAALFSCRVGIAAKARAGRRELPLTLLGVSDPGGNDITASAESGALTVLAQGTHAAAAAGAGGCQAGPAGGGSAWPLLTAAAAWLWRRLGRGSSAGAPGRPLGRPPVYRGRAGLAARQRRHRDVPRAAFHHGRAPTGGEAAIAR